MKLGKLCILLHVYIYIYTYIIGSIYRSNINRNSCLIQIQEFKMNIKLGVIAELDLM